MFVFNDMTVFYIICEYLKYSKRKIIFFSNEMDVGGEMETAL